MACLVRGDFSASGSGMTVAVLDIESVAGCLDTGSVAVAAFAGPGTVTAASAPGTGSAGYLGRCRLEDTAVAACHGTPEYSGTPELHPVA